MCVGGGRERRNGKGEGEGEGKRAKEGEKGTLLLAKNRLKKSGLKLVWYTSLVYFINLNHDFSTIVRHTTIPPLFLFCLEHIPYLYLKITFRLGNGLGCVCVWMNVR